VSRKSLIDTWGIEVILSCKCGTVPSHAMDWREAKCPVCREKMETVVKNHDEYYGDTNGDA